MGKGSKRRPRLTTSEEFERRWNETFGRNRHAVNAHNRRSGPRQDRKKEQSRKRNATKTMPKRKWSFNDEDFDSHVDLGDVHNELKARP